jgi:hypothetical protein
MVQASVQYNPGLKKKHKKLKSLTQSVNFYNFKVIIQKNLCVLNKFPREIPEMGPHLPTRIKLLHRLFTENSHKQQTVFYYLLRQ